LNSVGDSSQGPLRILFTTLLKLACAGFLFFTSVYCLLAFLPYTYYALIKAPPYSWMTWLVRHYAAIYWALLPAALIAYWPGRSSRAHIIFFGILVLGGGWLTWRPFLPALENDWPAYSWSLIALLPIAVAAAADGMSFWPRLKKGIAGNSCFGYSNAVLAAIAAALISATGALIYRHGETRQWSLSAPDLELTGWSAVSHVVVAMIVVSIVNLTTLVAARHRHGAGLRSLLLALLVGIAAWRAVSRFLANALGFDGWPAHLYAALFAATLVSFGISLMLPLFAATTASHAGRVPRFRTLAIVAILALLSMMALAFPSIIQGGDWNGVLQLTFALVFWVALTIGLYGLRRLPRSYSASAVAAALLVTCFAYWALRESAIAWAKPLGSTQDEIASAMEVYAARDASFEVAHHVLGNGREEDCGDLCRILRQHTNIRDVQVRKDFQLVAELVPVPGPRPNIFVFVIDSLRPDYLGAYQPRVDFTPQLDAFARDSVVFRNAYTQYAGTTLSEPAIWSGALLLHTHYLRPFARVNALEKLVRTNDYRMLVSYDTVLSQLLSTHDDLVKLDGDQPLWNGFEICATLQQATTALDADSEKKKPVFFYAQPMNVHQFARNQQPSATPTNWRFRPGFNNRVAYAVHQVDECLGRFFTYLKSRGLYDDSIIILTSDHGDATGDFGRFSHSGSIFPEIIRVPLMVHLPEKMRTRFVYDHNQVAALTDITPSLYSLLGYKPIRSNAVFGRPLFAETREELRSYQRQDLFLASDTRAVYGLLSDNGRFLYVTYDSPARSFLFDLMSDPNAQRNIVTEAQKKEYDRRIILQLQAIADFYGYETSVASLFKSQER
jgi:hypothetical protein